MVSKKHLLINLLFHSAWWTTGKTMLPTGELSSTLLHLHCRYQTYPPHDKTLYDTLHVLPNATFHDIRQNYRKLSRRYHPDKIGHQQQQPGGADPSLLLAKVRAAYETLHNDQTRWLYHHYGLRSSNEAVYILTGTGNEHVELQRLLGFFGNNDESRTQRLVADLVIRLRPWVEGGSVPEHIMMGNVRQQCQHIKRLPLGAHILRCVGRAYRHEGRRWLMRQQHRPQLSRTRATLHDQWRHTKHVWTAAVASGRALASEKAIQWATTANSQTINDECSWLSYHDDAGDMELPNVDNEQIMLAHRQELQARQVWLESLQIDALWKVCKVELDRHVRRACRIVLSTDPMTAAAGMTPRLLLPPSHHHASMADGWVEQQCSVSGSSCQAVPWSVVRERAAHALVAIGDVMVVESKRDTSWHT